MKLVAKQPIHYLLLLLIGLSSCVSSSPHPVPTPTMPSTRDVVATAWTALIEGRLVLDGGCLKVFETVSQNTYTLVFPPDFAATISDETVRITSGLIAGDRREDLIMIGDSVQFAGGTPSILNDELQKTIPSNCQEPYWVFGGIPKSRATPTSSAQPVSNNLPPTARPTKTNSPFPTPEPSDTPFPTPTMDASIEAAFGPLCQDAKRIYEYEISPDENWIAAECFYIFGTVDSPLQVVSKSGSKNWKLYFRDFVKRPTGYDWHDIVIPYHWSSDGQYLYAAARTRLSGCCWIGGRYILLVRLDLETGEHLELLNSTDFSKDYQISFTITDSSHYLLHTPTTDETYDFTVLDLRTLERQTIILSSPGEIDLTYAEMSPDDQTIVMPLFHHVENNDYDVDTLIKINRATGEQTTLISGLKPGEEYYPVQFIDNDHVLLSSAKPDEWYEQQSADFWLLNVHTLKMEKSKP